MESTAQQHSHSNYHPRARRILIVDDSELVTRVLANRLQAASFDVAAFNSGVQALRHAQENPPDCALVDIHLADFNGLVLAQQLRRAMGPDTPIFILSGDTSLETINSLPHVGATGFFPKPIESARLVNELIEWLERLESDRAEITPNPT
jgi:DNA-binding response OmpR family regulator